MKRKLSVGSLSVIVSDLTIVRICEILPGTQGIPTSAPVDVETLKRLDLYSDHLIAHSYVEGFGFLHLCAVSLKSGIPITITEYNEQDPIVQAHSNDSRIEFCAGRYLIGDIKTFSQLDLSEYSEGYHRLDDGTEFTLFCIPDYMDCDDVFYDQDNVEYSCASGYIGIIRLDYLPNSFFEKLERDFDAETRSIPYTYAVIQQNTSFTVSKFADVDDPALYNFSLGNILSSEPNQALDDLFIAQETFYDEDLYDDNL